MFFVIWVVLLLVKAGALIDCVLRKSADFQAVQTLQKNAWLLILALALLAHFFLGSSPIGLFNLIGTVAALVYLAQLRGSQH